MDIKGINLNQGNPNPKYRGKRSMPKSKNGERVLPGNPKKYIYTFKDAQAGEFEVLNTHAAWWAEKGKVEKLIDAYKFLATDEEACFYAGISLEQLKYFQGLHPAFYTIKHQAKQDPTLRAKRTVIGSIDKDKETAKWLLERIQKETFSPRVENTGANGRDLYDGLTAELKELGEELRNNKYDNGENTTEEHTSGENTGDANAEQDGNINDTTPATNDNGGQDISKAPSETV